MAAVRTIRLTLRGQPVNGISFYVGETVHWLLTLLNPDDFTPLNLTSGNVSVSLVGLDAQQHAKYPALISHQATPLVAGNGTAEDYFLDGETATASAAVIPPGTNYGLDVCTTDAAGNRVMSLGLVPVEIKSAASLPAAPITPLPSQVPLAQGPQGDGLQTIGAYSSGVTYHKGDYAAFDAGSGTSLYGRLGDDDTTGVDPTDDTKWVLAVAGAAAGSALPGVTTADNTKGLMVRGGVWVPDYIRQADIVQPFAVLTFGVSGGTLETGQSVTPTYSATYNRTPTSASVSDGTATDTLSTPFASGTAGRSYSRSTPGSQAFTLTANDGSGAVTHGASLAWEHRVWWGVAAPGALIEATAQGLASSALRAGRAGAFDFAAGDGTTVSTIVIPQSFGDFTAITVRPLNLAVTSDWIKVQTGLSVTNQHGVVEVCDVWQFDAATVDPFTYDAV